MLEPGGDGEDIGEIMVEDRLWDHSTRVVTLELVDQVPLVSFI